MNTPNTTELTPQEINLGIAELVMGVKLRIVNEIFVAIEGGENLLRLQVDYCNNWNDLMPLVVEHHKDLILSGHKVDRCLAIKNQQKELADCLLQVLEAKAKDKL